jgi:cytochrome c peroxidase
MKTRIGRSRLAKSKYFWLSAAVALSLVLVATLQGQKVKAPPQLIQSLTQVGVPDINKLGLLRRSDYAGFPITKSGTAAQNTAIQNELIALGKALFWDMQVGSDGIQACATCRYHAGADHRKTNQLSPGLLRRNGDPATNITPGTTPTLFNADTSFHNIGSGTPPNKMLQPGDFPFALPPLIAGAPAYPSQPEFGNNDVASSQGVVNTSFTSLSGNRIDNGTSVPDPTGFSESGHNVRRVEPRNAPTVFNAVFNTRNFWDSRANLFFNGVNPLGMNDPNSPVRKWTGGTTVIDQLLDIPLSSLASQAVGPPGSDFEMSWANRPFKDIGKKLVALRPLDRQQVSCSDSALGQYGNGCPGGPAFGLSKFYDSFIDDIFHQQYTGRASGNDICVDGTGAYQATVTIATGCGANYRLFEYNFALFFGLAVQAYEATLVTDQTPVDKFNDPLPANRIAAQSDPLFTAVQDGLSRFESGKATCGECHSGPEFTGATVSAQLNLGAPPVLANGPVEVPALTERMLLNGGATGVYDSGFYNIGVRPTNDDVNLFGRIGLLQAPLSLGLLVQEAVAGNANALSIVNNPRLKLPKSITTGAVDLTATPFVITIGCGAGIAPANAMNGAPVNGNRNGAVNRCPPITAADYIAPRGTFKTPSVRNIKFTGPYFHNGSRKLVREVLDFYLRGGDFNFAAFGQKDFDDAIKALGLDPLDQQGILTLLTVGLTDERVALEKGPFDHPQLCIPHGHNAAGDDVLIDIPAIGSGGNATSLQTFDDQLNGVAGVHDLTAVCTMSPLPNVP